MNRPIGLRCRCDLSFAPSVGGGQIVSDRIGSVHHELTVEEVALLEALASSNIKPPSLRDLQEAYQQQFAPRRITVEELSHRLGRFHEASLLIADQSGQGDVFWQRREKKSQTEWRWAWTQLLSIRLPGIDPQPMLSTLSGIGRLLFSPFGAVLMLVLWGIASLVLMSSASQFLSELPRLADLASPGMLISLLLGMAILKSLHELGHALACHRYGAQVREMGVLFLMFMPCLYSDVTDAWRLPSRGQRLLITLAGVLIELTIAAVAVLVWRFSEPGWVHLMALNIVLIASIGTLLVNLNPLMRYDGYYLLSDLTETPNLWTRSRQAVTDRLTGWFVRSESTGQRAELLWIAAYGIASQAFLYSLLAGFVWLLLAVTRAQHMEAIGWTLALIVAAGMVIPTMGRLIAWARRPRREQPIRKLRTLGFATVLTGLVIGLAYLPLPNRVSAPVVLVPAESEVIAVTLAGRLVKALPVGTHVEAGDLIARLESPEMARRLLAAETELAACQLELELIDAQRTADPSLAAQLPTAKVRVKSCQQRLEELRDEASRLSLYASRSGVLLPATKSPEDFDDATNTAKQLPTWSGSLLDPTCQGTWMEVGAVVGIVADTNVLEAELLVADGSSSRLQPGQTVRLALRQSVGDVLHGEVIEISRQATSQQEESSSGSAATWLPTQQQTFRKVRVRLETDTASSFALIPGGLGEARIDTGWQTVGEQLRDLFNATFRLP